tara:strand:+ start:324 stop:971 length:648 start_codon:yes stop_codon:yes gene_type:complete
MACITKGHTIACSDRNRRGGIKRIWLSEIDNVGMTDFAVDTTTGAIDQMLSTAAYEFEFERETAGFTANATRENGSTKVDVELEFYVPKVTNDVAARLNELTCSCGVIAVIETYATDASEDNYFFVLGWDKIFTKNAYLEFTSGEMSSGLALQDANGTAVKLAGIQGEYPRELKMDATPVVTGIFSSNAPASGFVNVSYADASLTDSKWYVQYTA